MSRVLCPVMTAALFIFPLYMACANPNENGFIGNRPPPLGMGPVPGTPGPWDKDVYVYRVGQSGATTKLAIFERAGVPSMARLNDGRLIAAHQYFPDNNPGDFDKVAVRFSSDEGQTWTPPEVIRLTGLPEGMRFPFDPTLVPLPDGKIRLYFTSLLGRKFEENAPAIYSAISRNAVDYVFERGERFRVEGRPVIDCSVVLHEGVFHLYAPDNGPSPKPDEAPGVNPARARDGVGYHATSDNGRSFSRVEDVRILGKRRWLGCAQSDGKTITFWGTAEASASSGPMRGGLWVGASKDGQTWKLQEAPDVMGADPGAVAGKDGGWIVIVTGPPRPGTPSQLRNQPSIPHNSPQNPHK